jgi:hypothetical protein
MKEQTYEERCEELIGRAVRMVATELRLVDLSLLVKLIQGNRLAEICDLLNSSSELYFESGTIEFGLVAELSLSWTEPPCISMDIEIRLGRESVFVKLELGPETATVAFMRPVPSPGAQYLLPEMDNLIDGLAKAEIAKR